MLKNKNKSRSYTGGYNGAVSAATSAVKLPETVPCGRCGKKKGHHCYSKNRLNDLRDHVRKTSNFDAARQGWANCTMCSGAGAQQLEIDCIGCDRTLPHTHFNKTQRRSPDKARCEPCQAKHAQYEPGADSSDEDGGSGSSYCSDDLGDDTSTMAGTFSSMSVTGTGNSSGGVALSGNGTSDSNGFSNAGNSRTPSVSTRGADVNSTTTNGTMRSGWTTSATHNSNVLPPGFDATKYGTPLNLRAKTAASDAGSSGGGKWAKIKAPDAVRRPIGVPTTKKTFQPAPALAPGAQDDDDIGVESEDSDDD